MPSSVMSQPSLKGRAAVTRSSPASVVNTAPGVERSGRLLTRTTMTSPASPWGFTILPTSSSWSPPAPRGAPGSGPSVVDEVDVGVHPVARARHAHHRPDGLGDAASTADHAAHVAGGDVDAEPDPAARLIGLDHHGVGLVRQGPRQVRQHGACPAPFDAVADHVVHVVLGVEVVGVPAGGAVEVGVGHVDGALNSSHAPDVRRSFSTRSVACAPWRSHLSALVLSISTTAAGSAVERPRGA